MKNEEIQNLIDAICKELESRQSKEEIGDFGDTPSQTIVTKWAHQILKSSGRDNWSGCILCRN